MISMYLVVRNAAKNATFFPQTIYGNANICIGVLFNRATETTFGIILFRLLKSLRGKKSLLALCRPNVNFKEVSAASEAGN